jgi:uncharacterized protein YbaR (Trm112 family)
MFVELLDKLRCPNAHEDSSLVATASRTVDRHLIDGTLGCPVCHAEFPIRNGAVDFGGDVRAAAPAADAVTAEGILRLGALLGLDERGGVYVLDVSGAPFIPGLAGLSPASKFIAVSGNDRVEGAGIVIRGRGTALPLAKGCARGIAVDDATPALLRSAVEALAPLGRLVAPADAVVPDGITVLGRDDRQWVGEREPTPVLSAIRRAPR